MRYQTEDPCLQVEKENNSTSIFDGFMFFYLSLLFHESWLQKIGFFCFFHDLLYQQFSFNIHKSNYVLLLVALGCFRTSSDLHSFTNMTFRAGLLYEFLGEAARQVQHLDKNPAVDGFCGQKNYSSLTMFNQQFCMFLMGC